MCAVPKDWPGFSFEPPYLAVCVLSVLMQVCACHSACVEVRENRGYCTLACMCLRKGVLFVPMWARVADLGAFVSTSQWNTITADALAFLRVLSIPNHWVVSGFLIEKNNLKFLIALFCPLMHLDYGPAPPHSVFVGLGLNPGLHTC